MINLVPILLYGDRMGTWFGLEGTVGREVAALVLTLTINTPMQSILTLNKHPPKIFTDVYIVLNSHNKYRYI